eukprot:TRINITY_DN14857_c0_g1_i1.p1 TRINITY_DN14857_c0_g1~~TRINITY_DN14857_c0_g1_i1.p1  ORF type:complete len:858 (-),score=200.47 TRINITY_DN14857_c0_g1_i1:255-2828(-)
MSLALQHHESPTDHIIRGLRSDEPAQRCGALKELGRLSNRMGMREIDSTIAPLLNDSDASVQEHALAALAELGPRAEYYTQAVLSKIQSGDKQVMRAALCTLGSIGPSASANAAAVESFLNHQDLDLVVDACTALGKMKATQCAGQVASKLTSSDHDVVFAACMSLSDMDCKATDVANLLGSPEARVRAAAVNALKSMTGAFEFTSQIAPLLKDEDSYVRLGAADFACRQGEKASALAAPAGALLSSTSPGVVAAAATALGGLGEAAAAQIPGLETTLRNAGEDNSTLPLTTAGISPKMSAVLRKPACAAATALAAMGAKGAKSAPRIAECLDSKDWEIRTAALNALSRMASSAAQFEYQIVDCLRDEAPPVAGAACLALGEIAAATGAGNSSTARAVAELMDHAHPTVRARAIQGLGMMGEEAHAHVETFVAHLGDRAWNVQAEAVRAVAKCGELGQVFAPDVCRMIYQGASPEVQVAACDALARMGARGAACAEEVSAIMDHPDPRVSAAARRALDFFSNGGGGDTALAGEQAYPAIAAHAQSGKLPIGLLFPGQGSQYVKMLHDVKDIPSVRDMLDTAKEILGYNLLDLCLNGPEDKLEQTAFCQPAVYVAGLAAVELLKQDQAAVASNSQAVAGLSLGEYTALTQAGVFSFETGLKLVKLRAEAMQQAAEASPQLMASVAGLDRGTVDKICEESKSGPDDVCQVANFLFPNGFSCAGSKAAIERMVKKAENTPGCLQCKVLKTSGAFHTRLMEPAKAKLVAALRDAEPSMSSPSCDVYMNVTGKKLAAGTPPSEIIEQLGEQLTSCVLWEPSMRAMLDDGIEEFFECGPGKQLKSMMKRIDASAWKKTDNVHV